MSTQDKEDDKAKIPDDIRAIRQLLVIYWLFFALSIILGWTESAALPEPLRDFIKSQFDQDSFMGEAMGSAFLVVLMGDWIVTYGLWNVKAWARQANLYLMGFSFVLTYFAGIQIQGPTSVAITMVGLLCWGAITALSFFGKSAEELWG